MHSFLQINGVSADPVWSLKPQNARYSNSLISKVHDASKSTVSFAYIVGLELYQKRVRTKAKNKTMIIPGKGVYSTRRLLNYVQWDWLCKTTPR